MDLWGGGGTIYIYIYTYTYTSREVSPPHADDLTEALLPSGAAQLGAARLYSSELHPGMAWCPAEHPEVRLECKRSDGRSLAAESNLQTLLPGRRLKLHRPRRKLGRSNLLNAESAMWGALGTVAGIVKSSRNCRW